jgi:hypothetical protein
MNTTPERKTEVDCVKKTEDLFERNYQSMIELDETIKHGYKPPIYD